MLDCLIKLAGVLGFFLACASLVWQVWAYYRSHKEDIKGELRGTSVPIGGGKTVSAITLQLHNDGRVPVYIKSVAMSWNIRNKQGNDATCRLPFKEHPLAKCPLKPGDGTQYVLAATIPQLLTEANDQCERTCGYPLNHTGRKFCGLEEMRSNLS